MASSSSYIDYNTFTSPSFSPYEHANSLVLATNNASDTVLDLSTPLSRVLFDVQEIDTHIDTLTTTHADRLIGDTQTRAQASSHILSDLETHVDALKESYARLEREVIGRYEAADQVRLVAERMVQTLRLGRKVQRATQMGRQLETQMDEAAGRDRSLRTMVHAASTIVTLRSLLSPTTNSSDGMDKLRVVASLRNDIVSPAERTLLAKAQQIVKEFSISSLVNANNLSTTTNNPPQPRPIPTPTTSSSSTPTFAQTEEVKTRTTSALQTLYLLSPISSSTTTSPLTTASFDPILLISALNHYLQSALTASLAALSRALATLPTLDRTLLEISARCQNLVALEAMLATTRPPPHPFFPIPDTTADPTNPERDENLDANLLDPLLHHLDTSSLPSYFWRSMAGQLSGRVHEILQRGGVSARTLRANRERVRDAIRECVDRGTRLPGQAGDLRKGPRVENWEREAAVMVSSVVGPLQR